MLVVIDFYHLHALKRLYDLETGHEILLFQNCKTNVPEEVVNQYLQEFYVYMPNWNELPSHLML